jgi:hypothetical protein
MTWPNRRQREVAAWKTAEQLGISEERAWNRLEAIRRARRTIARLGTLAHRVPAKVLAELLADIRPGTFLYLSTYLSDVEEYARTAARAAKNRPCSNPKCGHYLDFEAANVRYCSQSCRQAAYRQRRRVTDRAKGIPVEASCVTSIAQDIPREPSRSDAAEAAS